MNDYKNYFYLVVPPSRSVRQSNFELLRIVAMIFILILHVDHLSFGFPSTQEIAASPFSAFLRTWLETIAVVAVNSFVLISGYFGIRYRWSGLQGFSSSQSSTLWEST